MVASEEEIASAVKTLIDAQLSDPANAGASVTLTSIVRHVESVLAVDLSHKREFIKEQVDLLLGPPQTVQTPQFLFQPYNQIFFQPPFNQVGDGVGFPAAAVGSPQTANFMNPVVFHPQPLNQARDEIQFEGVSSGGGARREEVEFVAVVPPQQYGHGAVVAGARPIGSKLDSGESGAPKRKAKAGGLNMLCKVSPELQAIVGEPIMARTQIVKQLWAYIRANKLQDPYNKRIINCNDMLRIVFETDCTDMFQMNKLLAKHIVTINDSEDMGPDPKKLKDGITTEPGVTEHTQISPITTGQPQRYSSPSEQSQRYSTTTEQCHTISTATEQHVVLSDALVEFLGTEDKEMFQSEALSRVLDYVKENQLEDSADPTTIRCDFRLHQLFGCENLSILEVPEMLACHLVSRS